MVRLQVAGSNGLVISAGASTFEGWRSSVFRSAIVLNSRAATSSQANYLGVTASGPGRRQRHRDLDHRLFDQHDRRLESGCGQRDLGQHRQRHRDQNGAEPANDNEIIGNLIGTTTTGSVALGNGESGIEIDGASGTQIGFPVWGPAMSSRAISAIGAGIELTRAPPGR